MLFFIKLNRMKPRDTEDEFGRDASFSLNGTNISECSSCVYLGLEVNMANDLAPELSRRKRAAWGAFKSVEEVAKKTKNVRLRAHLFAWELSRASKKSRRSRRTSDSVPTYSTLSFFLP
ncbi:unnamed protein product [Heligmosomoides polygyrus]|uniref:Uncharacterized protein n=1 Tax=Heligmosomoides polygyrus TaxID=6339 RepID=A0A183FAX6_HELPZ|nr:unnamed protein product [Heligmosomoides polygyrus]